MNKLLTVFILLPLFCVGQKQGNIWYFGNHAGLDFNTSPPTPLLNGQTDFPTCCGWNEGSSSISDSSGSLLFYTNGEKIWNKLHQVMPHGDNLMGHASSTESSIIVPQPNSDFYFYVFTTDASENDFQNGLRYSIVNMCLDNNNGDITGHTKNILLIDSVAEKLICIKHPNGTDYWILTHKLNSDAFYTFRLTDTGIVDTIISHTGTPDPQGWGGQMVASPNGQKIAYAIPNGTITGKTLLLDFDLLTGNVSNEQTLSTGGREWGASFSPDNSKLYFSTAGFGELFQYDLNAGNLSAIIASKIYIIQNGPDSWRHHQLGPDGKIYISRSVKEYLSVIDTPNSLCPACSYIDSAVYLGGKYTSFGLPNFITSYDYSNTTYNCSVTSIEDVNHTDKVSAFPNPFTTQTTLHIDKVLSNATLILYNSLGQHVRQVSNISGQTLTLHRDNLSIGLYYLQLTQDNQTIATDKLVIAD